MFEATNAHWTSKACKEVWDLMKKIEHQVELDKQAWQAKKKEITEFHKSINSR